MKDRGSLILMVLVAFSALIGRGTAPSAKPQPAVTTEETSPNEKASFPDRGRGATEKKGSGSPRAAQESDPVQLYRDFFGLAKTMPHPVEAGGAARGARSHAGKQAKPKGKSKAEPPKACVDEICQAAQKAHYDLDFLIALVPDPVDSSLAESFDQVVAALKEGFLSSGYLLDSYWLPWSAKDDENYLHRTSPGLLLFRSNEPKNPREHKRLFGVFLVGETPKKGIHKAAFENAAQIIGQLSPDLKAARSNLKILGPFFSGSGQSLRLVLAGLLVPEVSCPGKIVTGSALAPDLSYTMKGCDFDRTILSDYQLLEKAVPFLQDKLGWEKNTVALLAESDTAYGASSTSFEKFKLLMAQFPSGISDIRTDWEKDGGDKARDEGPLKTRKRVLDLSLADPAKPVDIVPEFSTLSARSHELAIANVLAAISRDGIRHVGILATDVRDILFLARRIREYAPDVGLFAIGNHLLGAHPQYGADMDNLLVISNFPLVTEGKAFAPLLGSSRLARYFRRQFLSDFQEGTFHATLKLLDTDVPDRPSMVWIAAVGNGSLWPIAGLPASNSSSPPPPAPRPEFEPLCPRGWLQLGVFLIALGFLVGGLRRNADPAADSAGSRATLALGTVTVSLFASISVLVGTISWWSRGELEIWLVIGLALALLVSVVGILGLIEPPLIGLLNVSSFTFALPWILDRLWMPGGPEYFNLRARKLSSGLSPLVSLGCLCAAVYLWVLFDLQRRRVARQCPGWPLGGFEDPFLADCIDPLASTDVVTADKTKRPVLSRLRGRIWPVVVVACIPPVIFIAKTIQPVGEARAYGVIFLFLVLGGLGLSAFAFYQFFTLWRSLEKKVLRKLEMSSLRAGFKRIAPEVCWKPMRTFGWRVEYPKTLLLSYQKLEAVADQGMLERPTVLGEIKGAIAQFLQEPKVAGREGLGNQTRARLRLNQEFSSVAPTLVALANDGGIPDAVDFLAARVVRYLFSLMLQMRFWLLESLLSALFVLFAVRTYAFEPKGFVSVGIWLAILVAVGSTLWVFLQIDRNRALSTIGQTDPGKLTFDAHLFVNVLTYGVVPLLGIGISQFPEIGTYLASFFNPLLKMAGVD